MIDLMFQAPNWQQIVSVEDKIDLFKNLETPGEAQQASVYQGKNIMAIPPALAEVFVDLYKTQTQLTSLWPLCL